MPETNRRLSPEQVSKMQESLKGRGQVAIFATAERERIQFAADIAQAFAQAGWEVLLRENAYLHGGPKRDELASLVHISANFDGPPGIFLPVYIGSDIERSEVSRIVSAFSSVGIQATVLECNRSTAGLRGDLHSIYFVPITTAVPVVFVGSNPLGK